MHPSISSKSLKMIFLLLSCVYSIKIEAISTTGTPPLSRNAPSGVYNPANNSTYLFGGNLLGEGYSNILWQYKMLENEWEQIGPTTSSVPAARIGSVLTIYNNELYLFGGSSTNGLSSEFWSFNLDYYYWSQVSIKGDRPRENAFAACCKFEWNNGTYLAIFGGSNLDSSTNALFL